MFKPILTFSVDEHSRDDSGEQKSADGRKPEGVEVCDAVGGRQHPEESRGHEERQVVEAAAAEGHALAASRDVLWAKECSRIKNALSVLQILGCGRGQC